MISVVIVHWNTPGLLTACLESIRAERERSELVDAVVVTDCASDNDSAAGAVRNHPDVTLLRLERNDGYAAGCNAGIAASSSEFILFLNADTELKPCAIEVLLRCISLNPRIGLVAPLIVNTDASLQSTGYRFPGVANVLFDLLPLPNRLRGSALNGRLDPGNLFHPYSVDYALGAALLLRRTALNQIGGWPEEYRMYSEEVDLARRLDAAGWTRLLEPRAIVVHHGGASTAQRPAEMQASLWRSRGRYHRTWSSRQRQIAIRGAVEVASRLAGEENDGAVVRRSFAEGLAGQ